MAYIGRDIEYGALTKQTLTANSSTTVFALDQSVFDANSLLVSVGGVIQEPDEAYTASGTVLTFSEAPTTGDPIWIVYLGKTLGTSTSRGAITYQAATGNGSVTTVAMTSSGNTGNIVVTLNGVVQTPSTDFSVSGSTLTFTTAPFNGAAIGIHYLGKQARLGVPSSGSIVQADLANSGTFPAWDGSALTGIAGVTKEDIFELQNNIALLNFLRANDITAKRTSMLNGFQDQFRTTDGVLTEPTVPMIKFDGASDGLTISDGTLGQSDGKSFILSFYMKAEMDDGVQKTLFTTDNNRIQVYRSGDNKLGLVLENPSATEIAHIKSTNTITKSDGLVHCLIAIDMANTTVQMSLNGAAVETNVVLTAVANDNIDFTNNFSIAKRASVYYQGLLGQIYLAQEYLDISNSANREKFYKDGPVDFGSNGSKPTGSSPIIYLNNPYGSFQTNLGSGGNPFSVTGELVDGGYITDKIYDSSADSFSNSYELLESFGKENGAANGTIHGGTTNKFGNAITFASDLSLTKVALHGKKTGSPTGTVFAFVTTVTGTPGTDGNGTNTVLAKSNGLDIATLSNSVNQLVEFTFPEPFYMAAGNYWIGIDYQGGDAGNFLALRYVVNVTWDDIPTSYSSYIDQWAVNQHVGVPMYIWGNKNLDLKTKGTDELSEVSSPSSAPSKGHIEAFIDDKMSGEETITSSASEWSGNGTSHVTFSGNDIKVNTGDKQIYVPIAITGNFEVTGTWYGSTGQNSTGQNVNRGFALGFFASGETYTDALDTDNMTQVWYYDAPNQGSGAGDSFGYAQTSQGTFTPTNGDTFKFCRIGGTFYWYFADVLRHTWSQTYTGTGHIILNWSGVTNIEIKNLQWVTSQGTSATYPTVNTDIVGEMSRDGGTTWSPATLRRVDKVIAGSGYDVLMGDVDFTGDPSGTNIKGRIKTANQTQVTVKGMAVNWQ